MDFNRMARIAGLSAVLVAVLVVAHPAPLAAKGKGDAGREVVWPAGDITFEQTPAKGVTKADLWGNAAKGVHGSLVKFAAGTDNGLHTHTYDIKAVVISGTFLYGSGGAAPQKLGPGSYLLIPGGMKHTSGCDAGADCLFFEEQSGKFDIKPVKEGGAGKTKAK
jgi:quercetin dioxygenase-like cupin family protein